MPDKNRNRITAKRSNEAVRAYRGSDKQFDPQGSYTGTDSANPSARPVQDADDK